MPDDVMLPLDLPEIIAPRDVELFCAEQAEAIRVLGRRVVGDIIEIGNRLIAARGRLQHGEWLPWLEREFGWAERTALNFMNAANAFKSATVADLPIDAGALYLLAGPNVPVGAREAAIEKAEQGERISKEEAEKLIADKTREGIETAIAEVRAQQARATQAAIAAATERLNNNNEALRDELGRIEKARRQPDTEEVCRTVERRLGVKKLTPSQYKALAEALGQTIVVGRVSYDPAPREAIIQNEENLRIVSKITEALEILAGAPPADSVIAATWPVQRKQHARVCDSVIEWLTGYRSLLNEQE